MESQTEAYFYRGWTITEKRFQQRENDCSGYDATKPYASDKPYAYTVGATDPLEKDLDIIKRIIDGLETGVNPREDNPWQS